MALNPHSEQPDAGAPADYAAHHPTERPEQWGWHGEWGRSARISGWVVLAILVVMITATHYNVSGNLWLFIFAGLLAVVLLWDVHRRKNSWRK